VMGPFQFT